MLVFAAPAPVPLFVRTDDWRGVPTRARGDTKGSKVTCGRVVEGMLRETRAETASTPNMEID